MMLKKSLASVLGGTLLCTSACSVPVLGAENSENQKAFIESKKEFETANPDTYAELKKLTDAGFTFSVDDMKSLEESFSKKGLKLDLFEKDNLDVALKEGLKFILSKDESKFIDKKETLNKCILGNTLLSECIQSTAKYIENENVPKQDKYLEILKRLTSIKKLMEIDETIPKDNGFFKFVSAIKNAYQVVISRKLASEILNDKRQIVENKLGTENVSRGGGVSAGFTPGGVNLEISVGGQSSEGAGEKCFYRIDNSGSVGVGVSAGFKNLLSAKAGSDVGVTTAVVFYSLEQFLDTYAQEGKITSIKLRESEIKEIIKSRDEMQKAEKSLLSNMQTSVEWYLKASSIVPQSISFKWPEPTIASSAVKETALKSSYSAEAAATCLASLGMNVSASNQVVYTHQKHPYLNLIEEDCLASDYTDNAAELASFLKQEKCKKFQEIKSHVEKYSKGDKLSEEALNIIVSNVIGDVRHYNSVLSVLADKSSSKSAKKFARSLKRSIETEWMGRNKIKRAFNGRGEMLKAFVATSAYLREYATTQNAVDSFKQLYTEIEHLSQMQMFSKNIFKKDGQFDTKRQALVGTVSGQASLSIPVLGTTLLNIAYINSKSDAAFDTSEDIAVQTQLPMIGKKILGTENLKSKFKEMIEKLAAEKENTVSSMFKESLSLIDNDFNSVLDDFGIEKVITIPTIASADKYLNFNFYLTKTAKTSKDDASAPLPGKSAVIKKDKDEWILKFIKRIDSAQAGVNFAAAGHSVNASDRIGRSSVKMGDDTFSFITSRCNVCETGLSDSQTKDNHLWVQFKEGQKHRLEGLFKNLSGENTNAIYELQGIFNVIINNIKNNNDTLPERKQQLLKNCNDSFEELLKNCANYAATGSDEDFNKSSESLDAVLKLNYKYSYIPELHKAHALKK